MTQIEQIYADFLICVNPSNLRHLRAITIGYSVLIEFTGSSLATRQFWKVTVAAVIIPTATNASKYTHQYIGVL